MPYTALLLLAALAVLALLIVVCGPKAAASAAKPGILGAVYRNTGSYGSPTWTRWDLVRSVTPGFNWDWLDGSNRGTRAKLYAKGQIDLPFALEVRADDADAAYVAFWAAAMSPTTTVDLLILDGRITVEGAMGVRAEFLVGIGGQPQGAGDLIVTTFDLRCAVPNSGPPKSVVMGATSTPSFTDF